MTPDRWRQITGIFHAALAREAAEREAFVASSCGDDEALRREVASMLAAHDEAGAFGESRVLASDESTAESSTSREGLAVGSHVGPYEIVSLLGAGGMGAVYRARDNRLERDVALKVLPPAVANDPDRLSRFSREARVLASLNHANIAQIYGLEEADGARVLVTELVEGPTLADRIARGAIPIDEALPIAKQIAEALEAAHEHGVIHRDLKPANVKVRADGMVKVLDFGLAKLVESGARIADAPHESSSPQWVMSPADTVVGTNLGSIAYISPEQALGKPVDRRVDLWAFGCVLFEMLAGRQAFVGESSREVVSEILESEPHWSVLPGRTPAAVRSLLRRCLVKDTRHRLDSASVARLELEAVEVRPADDSRLAGAFDADAPSARRARTLSIHPMASYAVGLMAIAAGLWLLGNRQRPGSVPRLHNPQQVTSSLDVEGFPTWSPEGTRLAFEASEGGFLYRGDHDIWLAQLGGGEPVNLTKGPSAIDRGPSWSPDGREIGFYSHRDGEWGLYTVSAIGGTPRKILALPAIKTGVWQWGAPQWSSNGATLLASVIHDGVNVVIGVSLQSRETTRVTLPAHEGNLCRELSVSPDGRRFAYVEGPAGRPEVTRLWTIPASGGEAVPLTDGRTSVWSPIWSRDGSAVFYVSNRGVSMDLWQQAITPDGRPVGEPLAVTQGLGIRTAAFSRDGARLAYTRGGHVGNVWRAPILANRPATWADATRLTNEHAFIEFVDVSPDGSMLALSSDRRGNQDLWSLPAAGGEMTQLTTDPTPDWNPRWSPDGSEIAFYAHRSGNRDLWVMPSAGGPARQLTSHPALDNMLSWSRDGREIAFQSRRDGQLAVWIIGASGGEPRRVTAGQGLAEWSPDGRWLVVRRDVSLYRVASEGGEPVLIGPGYTPRFSHDGRSIYYSLGPRENQDFWKRSLDDGRISRLTKLEGRRGELGYVFSSDARFLYFIWNEDEGDIWVMDVATDTNR